VVPNASAMGATAILTVPADAVSAAQSFVWVFATIYGIVIIGYILTSWLRLPYSPWLNRIQRFLYDVSEPYLRLFRRLLPSMGPIDLSPMLALIVLGVLARVLIGVLARFH
jgi:YggT family protein